MQPRSPRVQPHPRSVRALAVTAGVALAISMFPAGAGPAAAHSELIASEPVSNAQLASAPELARLSFASPIEPGLASAAVSIGGAQAQELTTRVADGSRLIAELPAAGGTGAEAGADSGAIVWTVSYRVVALDGHLIDGEVSFSVQGGSVAAPSTTASVAPSVPGDAAGSTTPAPVSPATPTEDIGTATSASAASESLGNPSTGLWWPITGLSLLSLALIAVVILTARLRRLPER